MKAANRNAEDWEISFRDREAALARLVAEMQTLRKLVRLEEMKHAGETATVHKKVEGVLGIGERPIIRDPGLP